MLGNLMFGVGGRGGLDSVQPAAVVMVAKEVKGVTQFMYLGRWREEAAEYASPSHGDDSDAP